MLYLQFNSQNSSVSSQAGLGIGVQAPGVNAVTTGSLQQQQNSFQQSNQQALMTSGAKDSGTIRQLVFIFQCVKVPPSLIEGSSYPIFAWAMGTQLKL